MKRILLLVLISFTAISCEEVTKLFTSANELFKGFNKENRAIEICKTTKVQFSSEDDDAYTNMLLNSIGGFALGLNRNATWQDYANMYAEKEPNKKYVWKANQTKEKGIYVVAFVDEKGWGYRWEVTLETQTVKHIGQNEYLRRKYGIHRLDKNGNFEITKITTDTIRLERVSSYSGNNAKKVVCILNASVINKSGKSLTEAEISGELKVIFKDKTITGSAEWDSGFKLKVSKTKPWLPNVEKEFHIKTQGVEEIYLNYTPEYVFFEINLQAGDPIGFSYNKNIAEYDLINKWGKIKR